jgi:ribosomal protein S18 acetylase RimI-like enzyme
VGINENSTEETDMSDFINLTAENLTSEHLCCAIGDKKHQTGVDLKKKWLSDRLAEGHVFRKLNAKGKVFIEYASLEKAWIPVIGENYIYIYCLWVSGSFKDKGYGKELLTHCIDESKTRNKSGVCVISSKKKRPFHSDKKFFLKYGFEVVDSIDDFELLALSFDGSKPQFAETAKKQRIDNVALTIYYSAQCPFIANCIEQAEAYCKENNVPLNTISIDSLEKAKSLPCVFNNWAVFRSGVFESTLLLNENNLAKLLGK